MNVVRSLEAMAAWRRGVVAGQTVALVPTMGCYHEGHLALMRHAKTRADHVVVSLFVNPTQFGPNEDFASYPRPFADDCDLVEQVGVDLLFSPEATEMYPVGFQSTISVVELTKGLCGQNRPNHFNGVTTVVGKLFNLVRPDIALFGTKDFQQLSVIRQMVRDLNWDVEIVGHPIVREPDGLAMSSRNKYLSPDERLSALSLSSLLTLLRKEVASGERKVSTLLNQGYSFLGLDNRVKTDYLQIVDSDTLESQEEVISSSVLVIAVKIGRTRLIDNGFLMLGT